MGPGWGIRLEWLRVPDGVAQGPGRSGSGTRTEWLRVPERLSGSLSHSVRVPEPPLKA